MELPDLTLWIILETEGYRSNKKRVLFVSSEESSTYSKFQEYFIQIEKKTETLAGWGFNRKDHNAEKGWNLMVYFRPHGEETIKVTCEIIEIDKDWTNLIKELLLVKKVSITKL